MGALNRFEWELNSNPPDLCFSLTTVLAPQTALILPTQQHRHSTQHAAHWTFSDQRLLLFIKSLFISSSNFLYLAAMGRKTQSGGGGRPSGNSAFTHQESMAAAQMLQASFQSSGGKSVANSKRKPAGKQQEKFDFPEKRELAQPRTSTSANHLDPARGKQQPNSYTDNIPPLYSDQIADSRPPLPSQRRKDNPGSFAPGARKSTGTMASWAIGTEAKAFLAGNDKSQEDAGSASNGESIQSKIWTS